MTAMTAARASSPDQLRDSGQSADSPTRIPARGWRQIILRTWRESSSDNIGVVAAGVAFYGFLALVPLLGATVLTYGLVADPQTVVSHAQALTGILPRDVAKLIADQLGNVVETSGGKKGLGLLLALAIALWGARNAATSIITALNIAYEEEEKRSFVRVTLLALAMTAGAVVLALLAGTAIALLAALEHMIPGLGQGGVVIGKLVTYVALGGIAAGAAATMFRYAPSRDKARWTWITPGSLFFAVIWIVLTLAFGFYVSRFGNYGATYGSLSAIVVLLTWLYLSSYVLLFGAELNSEIEHQTAKDTTEGADQPLGHRRAWSADHVAGPGDEGAAAAEEPPSKAAIPRHQPAKSPGQAEHAYITARSTSRAALIAGLRGIGVTSSILSTIGLALLRRRGREGAGAALLLAAAGVALANRD